MSVIGQLVLLAWAVIQGSLAIFIQMYTAKKPGEDEGDHYKKVQHRLKYVGFASFIITIASFIGLIAMIFLG